MLNKHRIIYQHLYLLIHPFLPSDVEMLQELSTCFSI